MATDQSKIAELLKLDAGSLLMLVGEEDAELNASPEDKRIEAKRKVSNVISKIKDTICSASFIEEYCGNEREQRKAAAVAVILDMMGGAGHVTIAVLLVQVGIESVCAGTWKSKI